MTKNITIYLLLSFSMCTSFAGSSKFNKALQEMQRIHKELFDSIFEGFDSPEGSEDINILIEPDKQNHKLTLKLSGILLQEGKLDASVDADQEKKKMHIEVPTLNGTLTIMGQENYLSFQLDQQKTEDSDLNKHFYRNSMSQMRTISQRIDLKSMPEFSYQTENKLLSIVLQTVPTKQAAKKTVPIAVQ